MGGKKIVVKPLPSEQQEPTGPALQRRDGGFQQSDLQSDYQQLGELCLDLERAKLLKLLNTDNTPAALAAASSLESPQLHPSADVSAASEPSYSGFLFSFSLSATSNSVKKSKEQAKQFLAHPCLFLIVDLETLYGCGKFLSDSKPLEFETAD